LLPPNHDLLAMLNKGMTHQQIADAVSEQMGRRVSRATVTSALQRAGAPPAWEKVTDHVPWVVRTRHHHEAPLRMLRVLARRREGAPVAESEQLRLDNLLKWLAENNAVIAYCRDHDPGFLYVVADEAGDRPDGIPIRPRLIEVSEIIAED